MIRVNQPAPEFELPDFKGRSHRLSEYRGKIVVINFWSCECPHSERTDRGILSMGLQWREDVVMLYISANRSETSAAVEMVMDARRLPMVLRDADQRVADLYNAQTTPHIYVIDRQGILRYHGAVDDVTFRQRTPTRFHLEEALESLLRGELPSPAETPAFGCTIVREI
jgi:peroxiredoxin